MTTPRYDARTQAPSPQAPTVVGDRERAYVVQLLSEAFAANRLSLEDLESRLTMVYQATTTPQLAQLLVDPSVSGGSLEHAMSGAGLAHDFAVPERGVGVAIMGGFERGAGWVLPRHFKAVAVMGGVQLDLREARIASGVSEIEVFTMWGGVEILVPDGVRVEVVGMAVMGGFSVKSSSASLDNPDAPLIRISGLALMAGVDVSRKEKSKKSEKRYAQALRRADQIAKRP